MNSLVKTTIKRPITVCVLVIVLLATGVLATLDMSTNLLPDIALPMMGITIAYPGAGAQSVEDNVTAVMEKALQTVPGITELQTISYDNVSVAILTFDYGTDLDKKIDAIEDTFKTVTFPADCYDPTFVKIDMNGTATATIAVFNGQNNAAQLADDANALATKLRSIEGVGSVEVFGTTQSQIKITALNGLDVTSLLLVQALSNENLDIPIGTIMQDGTSVSIRNATDATSVLQVMQIPAVLELNSSVLNGITSLKSGVKVYATCRMQQFEDYVQKARDARKVIEDIEGKTADELEDDQNALASVKSLMSLVRNNTAQSLRLMWHTIDVNLVQNEEFVNMSDDDLVVLADQMNMSVDLLKWLRDECKTPDGGGEPPIKDDWNKLITFRSIFPTVDDNDDGELTGADITYAQFATLFQDGGSVDVETASDGTTTTVTKVYQGLDILHSEATHATCHTCTDACPDPCPDKCDRKTFTADEAEDVCKFADSVNTVAYNSIITTVRDAEEAAARGEEVDSPVISDAQFAALFVNTDQGSDFSALMSPQVIHVIRQDNFDNGTGSIVDILTVSKQAHVDANGDPVYQNGKTIFRDDDDNIVVQINGKNYTVNNFGRLVNDDDKLVDDDGALLTLTDEQIAANYYTYGSYLIYTDDELLALYNSLNTDADFGITPTNDTVRLIRICDFAENVNRLIVPVAYIGHVAPYKDEQSFASYNGQPAVTVKVFAVSDADTTKVVENVRNAVESSAFASTALLLDDKAQFINESIRNVLSSILIGGVLAILIIYLFVRKVGSSLVISITMPLSVLVALIGLWAMNITLNMVSLGGLAVGIGMLVDNSIVVLESITKRRDAGESIFDSCLNGTTEVAGSLLASTLTNICVFFPILFARGLTREIFYDLVWAVMFSIVMSLLVAVTVIPSLYHLIYRHSAHPVYAKSNGSKVLLGTREDMEPRSDAVTLLDGSPACSPDEAPAPTAQPTPQPAVAAEAEAAEEAKASAKSNKKRSKKPARNRAGTMSKMEEGYGKLLSKILTKRVWVCVIALVVFAASVGLVFTTGTEFMPSVDKGLIEVNMSFDASSTLDDNRQAASTAQQLISQAYGDDVQYISVTVGKQSILATNNTAVLRVQINTAHLSTTQTAQQIRALLADANLAARNVSVTEVDGVVAEVTGGMSGQSVTLLGDDMETLAQAAAAIANRLTTVEGAASVTDNTAVKNKQISFTFDRDECARRGIDYQNAVLMLRVGVSGHAAANVSIDGEAQDVMVQFAPETKDNLDQLLSAVVGFDSDGAVQLRDVLVHTADGTPYQTDYLVSVINKQDGKYVTTIDVESYGVDTGTMSKRIAAAAAEVLVDYPSVTYQEGGVAAYLTDAFNGLVVSLIAAFLLLYAVMACQFESLVKPFIVIVSIPLSFTGGFLALAITGTTLNVVSFVGIIMLMGVIVNDAIVLIDKINMLIDEGVQPQQAVISAGKSRLRPILMTSLTTILALIPLALGLGSGGELMQPMGIVVIGGLALGTMVTLVLIPSFYCIVKRINFKGWHPNKPDAEAASSTEQPSAEPQPAPDQQV